MASATRMTIRFRLGLALALALLPILALGVVQAASEFHHDSHMRRVLLTQAASRSATVAQGRISGAVALLQSLTPQAVGADCNPRLATILKELTGYGNIVRLDQNGRLKCAGASVPANADRAQMPWFVRLRSGSQIALTRALKAPEPALIAAVRAQRPDGGFDGAMVAVLKLASIRPDLSDPTLPTNTAAAVVTSGGEILAQTDPGAGADLPKDWLQRASNAGGLFYTAKDRSGAVRDFASAPLLNKDVFVVLSAPAPGVVYWARSNPFSSIIYPLLAWIVAWAAVWIVTERVVIRWLAYLDRIASIYAKGRFSVRPVQAENAPAEIRALALTLDAMAEGIVARDLSLRDSLAQKDAMMREIHHRVKNNLQVITSLLNMQQRALKDPAARIAMSDTRQRITALALIYRALYQSPDLRRVDVRQFLEELIAQLTSGEGGRPSQIRTELHADDLEIDPDKLAPLALFAVEAITNARKHAFCPGGGLIKVNFRVGPEEIILEIIDDGEGELELSATAGVGRTLMSAFARQLRGRSEIEPAPGCGVAARLIFPTPEPMTPIGGASHSSFALSGNQAAA
jgi:two-component sensor histidine kinase